MLPDLEQHGVQVLRAILGQPARRDDAGGLQRMFAGRFVRMEGSRFKTGF
ncbi:MAG: hypothetical protein WA702_10280 [Bradyrhizobium sp.]